LTAARVAIALVNNENANGISYASDQDLPDLSQGMLLIIEDDTQWVGKHRAGFVEPDVVSPHIRGGLFFVPFEPVSHPSFSSK